MKLYAGIDLHSNNSYLVVLDEAKVSEILGQIGVVNAPAA